MHEILTFTYDAMKIIKNLCSLFPFCFLLAILVGCRQNKIHSPQADIAASEQTEEVKKKLLDPQKPEKSIKQMTVEEAIEAVRYYESINHQALLIATYQNIIAKSKDPDVVATHLIKLADLYLADNNFEEAKKTYKKATTLYPGHQGIEAARYRELVAHFMSSLGPTRDQAATQTTINLGKKYLADFPQAEPERVRSIVAAAYKKLLVSEILVINFYINKAKLGTSRQPLKAALQRMDNIIKVIIPQLKQYDQEFNVLQLNQEWKERVKLSWGELAAEDLDDEAIRQRVINQLEQAVTLLHAVGEPGKSVQVSNLRDRF